MSRADNTKGLTLASSPTFKKVFGIKMSVDRSYSPYEVIRAYHDLGMMEWGTFATGELTESQNTFKKEKKMIE